MVKYANIFRYFLNYRFYVFIIVMICIIIIYITRSGKREGINSNECTTNIQRKDNEGRTVTYFCDSIFEGGLKRIRPGSLGITDYKKKKYPSYSRLVHVQLQFQEIVHRTGQKYLVIANHHHHHRLDQSRKLEKMNEHNIIMRYIQHFNAQ